MTRAEVTARLEMMFQECSFPQKRCKGDCCTCSKAIDALQAEPKYEDKAEVMRIIEDAQIVCHWNATDDFDDIAENIIEQTRKCILSAIEDELPSTEPYTDIVPITDKPIGEFDASTGIVTYYGKTRPSDIISRADALEQMAQAECGLHYGDCEADNCSCSYIKRILDIPSAEQVTSKLKNPCDSLLTDDSAECKEQKSKLESADAVQGEWEDREVFNETDDDHIVEEWQSARCSVCGKYHTTPYMYYFDDFNYCPNCGARMKGGAE